MSFKWKENKLKFLLQIYIKKIQPLKSHEPNGIKPTNVLLMYDGY